MIVSPAAASAILLLLGIAGIVIMTLGVRGRWLPGKPVCARCRHFLGPHEVVRSGRCPECGTDLSGGGNVRYFRHQVRPVMISIGAVIFLLGLFAPGLLSLFVPGGTGRQIEGMTVAEILDQLDPAPAAGDRSFTQPTLFLALINRAGTQPLTRGEFERFVRLASTWTASQVQALAPLGLGAFLADARSTGRLSDSMLLTLARAWYPPDQTMVIPPRVRAGGRLPIWDLNGRQSLGICVRTWLLGMRVGDRPIRVLDAFDRDGEAVNLLPGAILELDLPQGRQAIRASLRREIFIDPTSTLPISLGLTDATARSGTTGPTPQPVLVETIELDIPVEVFAADAPSFIELRTDPTRAEEVRAACRVSAIAIDRVPRGNACVVTTDLTVVPVPELVLSFDVILLLGEAEVRLGSVSAASAAGGSESMTMLGEVRVPCPDSIPDRAVVRFVPAPRAMEDDPCVTWTWGGTIELRDVPVRTSISSPTSEKP